MLRSCEMRQRTQSDIRKPPTIGTVLPVNVKQMNERSQLRAAMPTAGRSTINSSSNSTTSSIRSDSRMVIRRSRASGSGRKTALPETWATGRIVAVSDFGGRRSESPFRSIAPPWSPSVEGPVPNKPKYPRIWPARGRQSRVSLVRGRQNRPPCARRSRKYIM